MPPLNRCVLLTTHLHFDGRQNVLAVRADTSAQPASRWYAGAGIYRHVRLQVLNPAHLLPWGTFITTPEATAERAVAQASVSIVNQMDTLRAAALELAIWDASGRVVQTAKAGPETKAPGTSQWTLKAAVDKPKRWDIDNPALYQAVLTLRDGATILDTQTVPFGIREFHFDADTGFWLNGRNFKIKGVCLHADGGCFGAAVPLGVWERAAARAAGTGRERDSHGAQPARAGVSGFVRPAGDAGDGRVFRLLDGGEKQVRLSSVFHELVEDRRARHHSARPQSSEHYTLQRRERNPRHAQGEAGLRDPGGAGGGVPRERPDAAGDAGAVPART